MATRVTMNGGIFNFATARPFRNPILIPTASITTIAAGTAPPLPASHPPCSENTTPQSGLCWNLAGSKRVAITIAPSTLVTAIIEVCDKSMPPTISTNIWPITRARSGQTLLKRFARLRRPAICG